MTSDRSKDESNEQDTTSQETSNQSGWAALSSGQVTMGIEEDEDEETETTTKPSHSEQSSTANPSTAHQSAASSQPAERSEQPQREQPVSGMVSQRPNLPPSPVLAMGDAMRGFLRGMMPPQGLDAFLEELRTTATQVGDMYGNLFRFQVDSVERAISETRLGRDHALEDKERTEQK